MDEDTKRQYDALAEGHKTAWNSFMRRTAFEWKVSVALWTALAAFSGLLLQGKAPASPTIAKLLCLTAAASLLVLVVHVLLTLGIARGNNIDQQKLRTYEDAMRALTRVEWSQELQGRIAAATSRRGLLGYWSHWAQLLITLLLCAAAPLIIWLSQTPAR